EIYKIMLQCWAHAPQDRPTFGALRAFFTGKWPQEMKAMQEYEEEEAEKL
ncbi:unnamed protein product, partial [Allacma fusca]